MRDHPRLIAVILPLVAAGMLGLTLSGLSACSRTPAPDAPQAAASGNKPAMPTSAAVAAPAAPTAPATPEQAAHPGAPASPPTDRWLGQWTGPEGTFLRITGGQGRYELTIQDLDGPRQYTGQAVDGHIAFGRQGRTETLTATDGRATGMKWLDGKRDCLTVRPGEGYCRD